MLLRRVVILVFVALLFSSQIALAQFTQQGPKLVGTGAVGAAQEGTSVALSADGNTAIVGGQQDNSGIGAAWAYTRKGGVWSQQGSKLVGTGAIGIPGPGTSGQGTSIALSADGNTAIVGGPGDNAGTGAAWVYTRSNGVWTQQGSKLVGTGAGGAAFQGQSVGLSGDGNTAIVGGYYDGGQIGAAWVYTRSGGVWSQQGSKLVGTGAVAPAYQGWSVALSADGNTAIMGGPYLNGNAGAVWIYTRSNGVWNQQGSKLVGTGAGGAAFQGQSVGLSGDGNTAIVGGYYDGGQIGAAWVYTRSGGVWSQQGSKLVGTGAVAPAYQGWSVALSADGNTAIMGGPYLNGNAGAVWIYTRSNGVWNQQGSKLVANDAAANAGQGHSVALSADGNTAIVGGPNDQTGAAWVYTRSNGVWSQQGSKLVANDAGEHPFQGWSVGLSADGNTALVSGYEDNGTGAAWVYTRSSGVWTQQGSKLVGTGAVGNATQGWSVALSADGNTALVGGPGDDGTGAAWVFVQSALQVTPFTNIAASGTRGGPFSPSSFRYTLSATHGSVKYSITTPSWLTASSGSGTVTTSAKTITFTVNSSARRLGPSTYTDSIDFSNTTNNAGDTTRFATLIVNPKQYTITVRASPSADGTVSGGGTFAESTSHTVTATPDAGHTFVHWTENGRVVSTTPSYTFTLPSASVTLIADFH